MSAFREQLDAYMKQKYGVVPELLPFSHEDYSIYRHTRTGRWFAVFIVKERREFGLPGNGNAEIVCFKIRDKMLADVLARQPGYLRGYPSRKWKWLSAILDDTVPLEDICRRLDESYDATKSKTKNKKIPLAEKQT